MQPDVITLSVDEQNDGVDPVDHVFTRFETPLNRTVYIGANHSVTARDTLTLYRTMAKPNGNFCGVTKTAAKFSVDRQVTGVDGVSLITAPQIIEVSMSNPVGVSAAQSMIVRQRALAILDLDAVIALLHEVGMV